MCGQVISMACNECPNRYMYGGGADEGREKSRKVFLEGVMLNEEEFTTGQAGGKTSKQWQ